MNAFEFLSDSDLKVSAASTRLRNLLLGNISKRKKNTQQRRPSTAGKKSEKQIIGEVQQCSTSSVLKNVNNDDCCICSDSSFEPKETERRSKVKINGEFDFKKVNGLNKNLSKNEETFNCCETDERRIKEDEVQKKRKTCSGSLWDTKESKWDCVNVPVEDVDEVQQNKEICDYGSKFTESNNIVKKKTSNDNIVLFVDDSDDVDDDCMVIGAKTTIEGNIGTQQNSFSCSLNHKSRSINNFNISKSITCNESNNETNSYNYESNRYNNDMNICNNETNKYNDETNKYSNESNRCNNENNVIKTDRTDYDKISKEKLLESVRSKTDICSTTDFVTSNCNRSIQDCATPKKCSNAGEIYTLSTSGSDLFSPNAFSESSPQTSSEKLTPLVQQSYVKNNMDVVSEKDIKRAIKSYMLQEAVCDGIGNSSSNISTVGNSTMNKISKGETFSNFCLDDSNSFSSDINNVSTSFSTVSEDNISTLYSDKLAVYGDLVGTSPSVLRTVDISSSIDTICKSEQTNIENVNVNTKEQIPNTEDYINAGAVNTSDDNKFIRDDYNTSTLSVTDDSKCSTFFPNQTPLSTCESKNLLTANCFTEITGFKDFLKRYNSTYTQNKMLCNTDLLSKDTDSLEVLVSKGKKKIESHDILDDTVDIENKFITSRISSGPSLELYAGASTPTILYGLREMNLPMFLLFNPYSAKNASPGFNEAMNLLLIIAQVKLCDLPSKWTSAELSKFQSFIRHLQT